MELKLQVAKQALHNAMTASQLRAAGKGVSVVAKNAKKAKDQPDKEQMPALEQGASIEPCQGPSSSSGCASPLSSTVDISAGRESAT